MNADVVLDDSALDRLPKDYELPYSDGVPIDSFWHRTAIALLIETLEYHRRGRKDFFCGGDMFMYFSSARVFNKDFRGPDFFVVNGVDHDRPRMSWVAWQEDGRLPDVIVELSSPSTADVDAGPKRTLYRDVFRTPEYFIYDPLTGTFDGYHRRNEVYTPLEITTDNRVWSRELGLFIGTWTGAYLGHTWRWVRFFDADGRLIPTAEERAGIETERATSESERADLEAEQAATWREHAAIEAARSKAETARADAAEAELARLRAELAALKASPQPPPANP